MADNLIKITGEVKIITFRNVDGWAVFTIIDNDNIQTSCTGTLPTMVDTGHVVTCEGSYCKTQYGRQLKCISVVPAPLNTDTDTGVIRLLTLLPGIGIKKAEGAVKELGWEMAWRAAQECPSYLGISNYKKALIAKDVALGLISSYKATTFLLGIGVTENQANKIIKKYGVENAIGQMQTEPYQLIENIDGFGFRIVDGIALKSGIRSDSDQRALACILFCLDDNEKNKGNIWFYGKNLCKIVINELVDSAMKQSFPASSPDYDQIRKLVYYLGKAGKVEINKGKVYSKSLLDAERKILECLKEGDK